MERILFLNLQLFGESGTAGDGATGATGTAAVSQNAESLADVKYGIQEEAQTATVQEDAPDRTKEFERLIKEEYRDLYNAKVQDTIQRRLKSTKETVERFEALAPTIEMLSKKYGVDASDVKALNKAIEEDDSYYEDEALEKGITVEQLKSIRKMERENAALKKQMDEQRTKENADKLYSTWMNQAEDAKRVYPSFDLNEEMQNDKFRDLLRSNIDVRTAYEVIHKDDIIHGAMQFTAKTVEQKLANKLIANGARPTENGVTSQSASLVKTDVSQLSKADRQEIIRRVARGEKIRF